MQYTEPLKLYTGHRRYTFSVIHVEEKDTDTGHLLWERYEVGIIDIQTNRVLHNEPFNESWDAISWARRHHWQALTRTGEWRDKCPFSPEE